MASEEEQSTHFLNVKMNINDYAKYSDLAYNNQPELDLMEDEIERDISQQFKKYF